MSLADKKSRVLDYRQRAQIPSLREKEIVESRATARLKRSAYLEVRHVACEFNEGMLRLRGRVPSYYLKQMAQMAVLGMDGVDELHNQLEVVGPPDGRRTRTQRF
jgi:osmotically-inducible protein OsmY